MQHSQLAEPVPMVIDVEDVDILMENDKDNGTNALVQSFARISLGAGVCFNISLKLNN